MLIHKYTVLIAPLWIDGKMIFRVYKWWDEVEPHSGTHSSDRMREKWWRCFSGGWVLRVSRVWNPELLSGHLTYWGARGRGTRILKKSNKINYKNVILYYRCNKFFLVYCDCVHCTLWWWGTGVFFSIDL